MTDKMNAKTVEEVAEEQSFLVKNWKKISICLGAILVVVLGVYGYCKLIAEPREQAATEALAEGQQLISQGEYEKAIASLKKEVEEYGSTQSGNLALLYLGIAYYNTGKYTEAIAALEDYSKVGDNVVDPAAIAALGNCYACTKNYDKAVEKLVSAAELANSVNLSPIYYIQAGEICEFGQNNNEKALELYNKVKSAYKTSYQVKSGEIDKYIERASVK